MNKILISLAALLLSGNLFAHSDAFKPEFVQTLIAPYLSIQTALASDDLKKANTAGAEFAKAMKKGPQGEKEKTAVAAFVDPSEKISTATSLEVARDAFVGLSTQLQTLVRHVGISGKEKLYSLSCPMADHHKGASWLQDNQTVNNPYLGTKMPHCGSVKKQIAGEKEHDAAKTEHKTHDEHGDADGHEHH